MLLVNTLINSYRNLFSKKRLRSLGKEEEGKGCLKCDKDIPPPCHPSFDDHVSLCQASAALFHALT